MNTNTKINTSTPILKKLMFGFIAVAVAIGAITWGVRTCMFHKLENHQLAINTSMFGDQEVRTRPGWWFQWCPTIVKYSKAGIYTLNDSESNDSLWVMFNNKTKACLDCQIGYRIDTDADTPEGQARIIALHQLVEGSDKKIWEMVLSELNDIAQKITTKYDPTDVIGGPRYEEMGNAIRMAILHDPILLEHNIDVDYFSVRGKPGEDDETAKIFAKIKAADLLKREAQAEKIRLEAETLKTKANYDREIAEFKGKADAETAKMVTEANRQKELAEIAAKQKVEVEKLAKEQLLVQMQKEREASVIEAEKKVQLAEIEKQEKLVQIAREKEVAEVNAEKERVLAEIAKRTEAERLEQVRLQSEQVIAQANAKKEAIALAGDITETERTRLEYDYKKAQAKWENLGKGIASITLPKMVSVGGSSESNGSNNPLNHLINTMTLEKIESLSK